MRAAVLAAAVLVLAACGDDDDAGPEAETTTTTEVDETTTTEEPSTTSTTLTPEEEVVAAYRAANDAFLAAGDPPTSGIDLSATHTGESLRLAQSSVQSLLEQGIGARSTYESETFDVVITGDVATFRECYLDRTQLYDLATGADIGAPGETVLHLDVRMERVDGVWKLAASPQRSDTCTLA